MKPLITPEQAEKAAKKYVRIVRTIASTLDEEKRGATLDFIAGIDFSSTQYADNVVPVIELAGEALKLVDKMNAYSYSPLGHVVQRSIQSCLDEINELLKP